MMKPIQLQAIHVFLKYLEPLISRMVACQSYETLDEMYKAASKIETLMKSRILPSLRPSNVWQIEYWNPY